ncbi:MAG: zinc ribbon domain-containing protein [Clostridia bacterium]|nr:zinc ribbon domain-containing protein [Clostridia bacterium]
MYCIKCGVELADTEKSCPLCGTVVYHPDIVREKAEPTYPKNNIPKEEFNRTGILFIITMLFAIPFILTPICDISLNKSITWSGYCMFAVILTYVIIVLPSWFKRPHPIIFTPVDFGCIGLYLCYINYTLDGDWFLSLAFPAVMMIGAISCTVTILCVTLRRGYLYIFGGASLAIAAMMVLIEFFINITFDLRDYFIWSLYPMIVFALLGAMLLTIAICRPLRESLHKKFFI